MEISSRSTAVISGNVIYGYDTPAASDGSNSAGIYVENAYTGGLPHVTKTVVIVEPVVHFGSATYSVDEAAGLAVVTVTADPAPATYAGVSYTTAYDGTATPGSDYTPVSGTLTFAPGQEALTFSVPILDDDLDEPAETVALALSDPVSAGLGLPFTATLTLTTTSCLPSTFHWSSRPLPRDAGAGNRYARRGRPCAYLSCTSCRGRPAAPPGSRHMALSRALSAP